MNTPSNIAADKPLTPSPDPNPRKPKLVLPEGAWDCILHVYGPPELYPFDPGCPYRSEAMLPETYIRQQEILGLSKAVIVNGAGYGFDNRYLLETLRKYPDRFRAVTYVKEDVTPSELRAMGALGLRGARFAAGPAYSHLPQLTPEIAKKLADNDWHCEFLTFTPGGMDVEVERFKKLPNTIVIDHFGKLDPKAGLNAPGFRAILELLDTGKVWLKMSNPRTTTTDENFPYASVLPYARALVAHAPERLVWGSNWPHVMMMGREMANDGDLVDLIAEWAPDAATRQRIMVDNPMTLYGR